LTVLELLAFNVLRTDNRQTDAHSDGYNISDVWRPF